MNNFTFITSPTHDPYQYQTSIFTTILMSYHILPTLQGGSPDTSPDKTAKNSSPLKVGNKEPEEDSDGRWIRIKWERNYELLTLNSLRPRQNGRLFADDTFKRIFLNENIRISTENSLKFVPKGLINNIPALVLIMAWRRPGDKPLSEPMLVRSLTHICVTRPQWVKRRGPFFQNVILFSNDVHHNCNIFIRNCSNTMNV